MSTETPARQLDDYTCTLDVPHASAPTEPWNVYIYDIGRGPKRVKRVNRWNATADTRLLLPPRHTWTLDTVRMALYELCGFLSEEFYKIDDIKEAQQWAHDHDVMAAVSVTSGHRTHYFKLSVECLKVGASIQLDGSKWNTLSEPMRAALMAFPTAPFPLAAIACPSSRIAVDREDTLDDVNALRRMTDTLKEIAYLEPEVFKKYVELIEAARSAYVDDDDDE